MLADAPGRIPLWNPYLACGLPLLADPQAHVLYPPALLFRFLPFPEAFGWFLALHAILATTGMAVFLRGRGLTPAAAAVGAVGFGLGAHPSFLLAVPPALCGYAWLPWVAAAAARVTDRPCARETAGLAIALGWLFLAGSPPYAVYGCALAAILLAVPGGRSVARLGGATAAGALGLALAAGVLLPFAGYLGESIRAAPLTPGAAGLDAMRPAGLLGLVWPAAVIPAGPGAAAVGLWPSLHYLGVIPALLAAGALVALRRDPSVRAAAAILAAGLVLAVGPSVPGLGELLLRLPPLDRLRHPAMWMSLGGFGLAWLAATGADALAARSRLRHAPAILVSLAALTWVDLALVRNRIQLTARAGAAMTPGTTERFLAGPAGAGWHRVFVAPRLQESDEPAAGADEAARLLRASLRSNLTAVAGLRDADADNPIVPAGTASRLAAAKTSPSPWTPAAAAVFADLGVRHLIARGPIARAPDQPVFRGHVAIYALAGSRGPVWLEPAGAGILDPPERFEPGRWSFRVRTTRPCTAVVAESALRGWRMEAPATARLAIVRGALLGVSLPPGDHAVRIRYDPWQARAGLCLGLLASVALLAAGFRAPARRRPRPLSPSGRPFGTRRARRARPEGPA
ncbi:MAG: hypothetical protein AAB152_04760 [Candidatus Coatesbacteria bacterium]